jgi:TonB-dependent Receptor Plug Domain
MIVTAVQVFRVIEQLTLMRPKVFGLINYFIAFFVMGTLKAQNVVTLNGIVKDYTTGERISEVVVSESINNQAVRTNKYGQFAISTKATKVTITATGVGYLKEQLPLLLTKDTTLYLSLRPLEYALEEVKIVSDKNSFLENNGNFRIPIEQIKKMPALLSEVDVLKALQFLPGVQQGTEGSAGLYVRGGSPDQTLILIDGVAVYNAYHLFGFFSVFNPDAIANVRFYKTELPAKYGGRLSAVVDIETKEGNQKKRKRSFAISPISGKFMIEGPIIKNKASFIVAGRRTFLDIFSGIFQRINGNALSTSYNFRDFNAKFNYTSNPKNNLYASFYSGRDIFKNLNNNSATDYSKFQIDWGNYTGIVRWNQTVSQRLFQNTTASYTKYNYRLINEVATKGLVFSSTTASTIRDLQLKTDWDYYTPSNSVVNFGIGYTCHRFRPEIQQIKGSIAPTTPDMSGTDTAVNDIQSYLQKDIKITPHLRANIGLHHNSLLVNSKYYGSLQPRLYCSWQVSTTISCRGAFFSTYQYLHLLTNSSLGLPTDLWVPVTEKIPPQKANQISWGIAQKSQDFQFSLDVYLKKMFNLLEYLDGATFLNDLSSKWYDKVTIGQGESKGIEFFGQKNTGKTQGFISYTLARTTRTFGAINGGLPFPFKYDRRHNLSVNVSHHFTKNKDLAATFNLMSGSVGSLPSARYVGTTPPSASSISVSAFDNYGVFFEKIGYIPSRNNYRLPFYHRMDVSYQISKKIKRGEQKWVFSVYNVYNRANPFAIFYDGATLKQFSLLPIIPSVGYELNY